MPFRADEHALKARKEALEHALREIREAQGQFDALKQNEAERVQELADVESLLRTAGTKRGLPLLDNLRIAAPCHVPWESMKGDEHVRFCSSCEKNVYDLSALSPRQAEALLRAKEGNLCVTYFKRADGTVLTADCPVGLRRRRLRNAVMAIAAATGAGAAAAFAMTRAEPPQVPEPTVRFQGGEGAPAIVPVKVFLRVLPSDASVEVNGNPTTREQDGTIALVGPMGAYVQVAARIGDRSATKEVLITGTGPFPSSISLVPTTPEKAKTPPKPPIRTGGLPF